MVNTILKNSPETLSLPIKDQRPELENFYGGRENFTIDESTTRNLYLFSNKYQVHFLYLEKTGYLKTSGFSTIY